MVKEMALSLEENEMCKMSMRTDPSNEDSTHINRKICILDHLKNL